MILAYKRRRANSVIRTVKKESRKNAPTKAQIAEDPDYSFVRDKMRQAILKDIGLGTRLRFGTVAPGYRPREDWEKEDPKEWKKLSSTTATTKPKPATTTESDPVDFSNNNILDCWEDASEEE